MGKRATKPTAEALRAAEDLMNARRLASDIPQAGSIGYSPVVAAQLAGITREGINKAVMRGTLKASRFTLPGARRGLVIIDAASLAEYIARNRRC